jgi:hypothetical protein
VIIELVWCRKVQNFWNQGRYAWKSNCTHLWYLMMIYDVSQLNLDLTMIMTLRPWFPCWRSLQQPFQFGQHQWCPPRTVRCDNFHKTRRDETNLPPRFCKDWQRSDSIGNDGYSSLFEFWEKWSLNAGNAVTILPQWDPNIILHNHHVAVAVHKTTSSMEKPKYSKVQQVEPWAVKPWYALNISFLCERTSSG